MQHDAQLDELRRCFAASPALAHLPSNASAIVVVNRNEVLKTKCKRCVPAMNDIVERLREEFKGLYAVVEVFGTEPYADQVGARARLPQRSAE